MSEGEASSQWQFIKIGLIVTGKGEERFLPIFLRSLTTSGRCTFRVLGRIGQLSPVRSHKRQLKMVGSGKVIPDKDAEKIGVPARKWLDSDNKLLLLIDDLEHDRREAKQDIFDRYRAALDTMLISGELRSRASVHFLVNMLEAYYFADAAAVNAVLRTSLSDYDGDVEEIPHPKNKLKRISSGFDEVEDGEKIVRRLDLEHVLDRIETCASLRVLFAWCITSIGLEPSFCFRLDSGTYDVVTGPQLGPALSGEGLP